jgi:hypothetical protein
MTRVPEEHIGEATPVALRKLIENEMRAPGDQPKWRCVAVTRDRGNITRIRILGRNEEEVKKIKDIMEAKKTPGARVLRDQLYLVKVDNVNRTAVIDHEGRVLHGATEALSEENEVQIAKMAWLSRRDTEKAYGSMVVAAASTALIVFREQVADGDCHPSTEKDLMNWLECDYSWHPPTCQVGSRCANLARGALARPKKSGAGGGLPRVLWIRIAVVRRFVLEKASDEAAQHQNSTGSPAYIKVPENLWTCQLSASKPPQLHAV